MNKLRENLKKKLTKKELGLLITSFDIVGDIAIIEIPLELQKKEKIIGNGLLNLHKKIKVVAKKAGIHKGIYRKQALKIIAGVKRKETVTKENNIKIKLHVENVYYSVRTSTERKRIMSLVKPKESVLIMFSGSGAYCLIIAKNTKVGEVYGVEINPIAHKYALENVELNKLTNVQLFEGDVRLVVPRLKKKFDRIVMPLPASAYAFLDTALKSIKKNGIIHFYDFENLDEIDKAREKVKNACKLAGKKYRILKVVKTAQVGPRKYKLCVDFKIIS